MYFFVIVKVSLFLTRCNVYNCNVFIIFRGALMIKSRHVMIFRLFLIVIGPFMLSFISSSNQRADAYVGTTFFEGRKIIQANYGVQGTFDYYNPNAYDCATRSLPYCETYEFVTAVGYDGSGYPHAVQNGWGKNGFTGQNCSFNVSKPFWETVRTLNVYDNACVNLAVSTGTHNFYSQLSSNYKWQQW